MTKINFSVMYTHIKYMTDIIITRYRRNVYVGLRAKKKHYAIYWKSFDEIFDLMN